MTWLNVLARLILCPIIVAIGDFVFAGIHFAAPSQWIAVGFVMAIMSVVMDTVLLDRLGLWWSFVAQTVLVAGILRVTPSLMAEAETTRLSSLGVGVLLGLVEVVMYWWLFRSPGAKARRPQSDGSGT